MLNELEQVIKIFKEKLGKSLVGIALFGSAARNEAHIDSDRDIFIIANELPDNTFERQMFLRSLLPREVGTKFSVMAKTRGEFERRLLPVYLDIATDAMILFDSENYLRRKFRQIKKLLSEKGLTRKKIHNTLLWVWAKPVGRDWELDWR